MNKFIIIFIILCNYCFSQNYTGKLILTTRWFHPRNSMDTLSTLKAIRDFKPSRIDWVYTNDSNVTNIFKKLNIAYSLTANPMCPDSSGYTTQKLRIKTINGETYIAPWMKSWKIKTPYWGCVNNPEFQKLFLDYTKSLVKLGPDGIMVDNPEFNARLERDKLIGCFCDHCERKFINKKFRYKRNKNKLEEEIKTLIENSKDKNFKKNELQIKYEEFQINSVTKFLANWKKELLKTNPNLKFFCNNYNGEWRKYHLIFDGGIAEITESNINDKKLDELYKLSDSLKKSQLFNCNSGDFSLHEKLLIYNLKHNRDILIPWDLFILGEKNRFYMDEKKFNEIINEY
ncbi:MAG: hypothetical protein HYU67_13535 [Flavobacteriia bacterium]|nr:hypothetical protein [Flavobacteriia bacterium]